jgi:HicB family
MELSPQVQALQQDMAALGSLGDETVAGALRRLGTALQSSFRLRLLEAIADAADEVTPQLPGGRIEVRLEAGDPILSYVDDSPAPLAAGGEDALDARITLRLPESLKTQVEAAAIREALSVNAWLVQVIARGIESRPHRFGSRITGFARS